jgi:hypothetical protein
VTFLRRVKDITQEDLPKLNSAIRVALSNSSDLEKSLSVLVPLALPMLSESKLTLDVYRIYQVFISPLSANCVRLIHEYVVALANSNPEFRRSLLIFIQNRFDMKARGAAIPVSFILLWQKLAIYGKRLTFDEVRVHLFNGHSIFERSSDD